MEDAAVYVRNAHKSYGDKPVLKNFSMTVPKGSIYGLLGASGCGKTTLLSCIVGRKFFNSGELWVLGGTPGTPGSGVPGPRVGYMPQELALVGEFTVKDAVYYFGKLLNVDEELIASRFKEFQTLLDLPPSNRYLRNCSGGQQRRVSFAAALINMPELLILDEPTSGVDPLLRERIWNYLAELVKKTNTAVIITTHYIEETRQANKIGLMREGRLLAEETPTNLLNTFGTETLEDVFLLLSQQQEAGTLDAMTQEKRLSLDSSMSSIPTNNKSIEELLGTNTKKPKKSAAYAISWHRMSSLVDKNWKQFIRNTSGLFFFSAFPILQVLSFLLAVGGDVRDIPLAVVNNENFNNTCSNFTKHGTAIPYDYLKCHLNGMSCRFLKYLETNVVDIKYIDNIEEGIEGIKHGKYVGAIYISRNFSASLEDRYILGPDLSDEKIPFSEIQVYMDMSNRQIGQTIKYKLFDYYKDFQDELFDDCQFQRRYGALPISFKDPVFGNKEESYTIFLTPGVCLTLVFFLACLMTSQIIITDRLDGVWDRSAVAGVSAIEITLSHFILQVFVVFIQATEVFVFIFFIWEIDCIGNLWVIHLMIFLQGICGMVYGFWISIISVNHTMADAATTGTFYPMIIVCGTIWPLEGMPKAMRYLSKLLPFTIPAQSLRNVMRKGWTIDNFEVYQGILIEVGWICFLTCVCIYMLKLKR